MKFMPETIRTDNAIIAAVLTILGTVLLTLGTSAWSSKESVVDHKADIELIRSDIVRVMDAICYKDPQIPQCTHRE